MADQNASAFRSRILAIADQAPTSLTKERSFSSGRGAGEQVRHVLRYQAVASGVVREGLDRIAQHLQRSVQMELQYQAPH